MFKEYDADSNKALTIEEMTKLVNDLWSDKCVLGKIPDLGDEEVEKIFDQFDKNDDGKITWIEFRNKMNNLPWKI